MPFGNPFPKEDILPPRKWQSSNLKLMLSARYYRLMSTLWYLSMYDGNEVSVSSKSRRHLCIRVDQKQLIACPSPSGKYSRALKDMLPTIARCERRYTLTHGRQILVVVSREVVMDELMAFGAKRSLYRTGTKSHSPIRANDEETVIKHREQRP